MKNAEGYKFIKNYQGKPAGGRANNHHGGPRQHQRPAGPGRAAPWSGLQGGNGPVQGGNGEYRKKSGKFGHRGSNHNSSGFKPFSHLAGGAEK